MQRMVRDAGLKALWKHKQTAIYYETVMNTLAIIIMGMSIIIMACYLLWIDKYEGDYHNHAMHQEDHGDLLEAIRLFDFMLYHMHRVHVKEADRGHLQIILGLSVRQLDSLRALNYLLGDERDKGIPLKRLAQQMWMSEPAASLLVDKMVKKGFFIREENPNDRRSICIRFSEEGEAKYEMLADGLRNRWQSLFSKLPEEDQSNFKRIIHQLHEVFNEEF